uniref:Uncharacterized protein n=1 Tax=Acrobeloides nanus TaxID=290746 RepID=A0A914BZE1_9BILA
MKLQKKTDRIIEELITEELFLVLIQALTIGHPILVMVPIKESDCTQTQVRLPIEEVEKCRVVIWTIDSRSDIVYRLYIVIPAIC